MYQGLQVVTVGHCSVHGVKIEKKIKKKKLISLSRWWLRELWWVLVRQDRLTVVINAFDVPRDGEPERKRGCYQ